MRKSFKVAPGVRIRASSRGVSAGIGPRAARVHVGSRGVGVSSGIGPVSAYTRLGGGTRDRSRASARGASAGTPTKTSIAARERELKAAQREADIDKIAALEKALVSVHNQSFPNAERIVLAPIEPVDPASIQNTLEAEVGIPELLSELGGVESAPLAPEPAPVDRYELMREHRKRERIGIPIWRLREQIGAARRADELAEAAAAVEQERRRAAQAVEQERLDRVWADLQAARARVVDRLTLEVETETKRCEAERAAEQAELDRAWEKLLANDPETTMLALEQAFADNDAPAAPLDCDGNRVTILMQFKSPEAIVPERKPARTPTGKRTLKKRTKTELNDLYRQALGSNVLATVKETFAVAPGAHMVQMLVVRRETEKKREGELAVIYIGEFDRSHYEGASGSRDPSKVLTLATESELNLKGKTEQIAPLDLAERTDLQTVLAQVTEGLGP
jgi:hypothetical protein